MTSPITAMLPDTGLATSGNLLTDRQTDAENQRQTWLRQMEMSQISLLEQFGDQTGNRFDDGTASSGSFQSEEQSSDLQQNGPSNDARPVTLMPVHTITQQNQGSPDAEAVSGKSQGAGGSSLQGTGAAAASTAMARVTANNAGSSGQLSPGASATVSNIAVTAAATSTAKAASQNAQAAIGMGATQSATAALQENAAQPPAVEAKPAISATLPRETAALSDGDEETGEVQHDAPSSESPDGTSENWQKRFMHVAQDGTDLSISIRDNALDAGQSAAIVNRLAGDAAQVGLKLSTATVNGKTILKQEKTGNGGKTVSALAAGFADNAPVMPFPISNTNGGNAFEEQ